MCKMNSRRGRAIDGRGASLELNAGPVSIAFLYVSGTRHLGALTVHRVITPAAALFGALLLLPVLASAQAETPAVATPIVRSNLAEIAPTRATNAPSESPRKALSENLSAWCAFPIGLVGSLAYLVAVWVGMVARDEDARGQILEHFRSWRLLKVSLYLASGGSVAMVFQFPEAKLIPIQAFIIGCTWPAVVANYISGRQTGVPEQARQEFDQARQKQSDIERVKVILDAVPHPVPPPKDDDKELAALLKSAGEKDES